METSLSCPLQAVAWVIFTDLPHNSVYKCLITATFTFRKYNLGTTEGEMFLSEDKHKVLWRHKEWTGNQNTGTDWGTLLPNSPKKLKNVQMAAVIPCVAWQLCDCEKISQVEVSDSYMWVTERDVWQLFRPHESAAATGKQKPKWKFLEEAECSMMSAEMPMSLSSSPQICLSMFLLLSE